MNQEEKINRLRLFRSEQVGPVMFKALLKHFKTPERALEVLPEKARKAGRQKPLKVFTRQEAEQEFEALEKIGAEFVFLGEESYPKQLAFCSDAPPVFSILGRKELLNTPHIGIVGTRNASINGKNLARHFANDFVKLGYTVCSGLALGIDAAAHEGALYSANEKASTTAVLGSGIDVIYPSSNKGIYAQIKEMGLIISEYPAGSKPQPSHFPQRNRIISGLSEGLVVIEAALHSGSLITANKALEQGREVFAVPASPLDPRASGVNHLIKNGAPLVETAQDVLNLLQKHEEFTLFENEDVASFVTPEPSYETIDFSDKQREDFLSCLDVSEIEIDELIRETGLSPAEMSVLLVELELGGQIERLPGNKIIRISSF